MTNEPRKPIPLDTMIGNAVDCLTGIFVYHGIVDSSDQQWQKKYIMPAVTSHLPLGEEISYHTVEVIRQTEGSRVVRNE